MSHEMAFPVVEAVSGHPKWLQTTFWSFQAARNGCKPLFGHFGRPEMAANYFLVVSGEKMRLRGGAIRLPKKQKGRSTLRQTAFCVMDTRLGYSLLLLSSVMRRMML